MVEDLIFKFYSFKGHKLKYIDLDCMAVKFIVVNVCSYGPTFLIFACSMNIVD